MYYNEEDLSFFINNIYDESYSNNNGGMGAPDLFSLYCIINKIKPKVVIESGVWNGISTKLIRKVLPDSIIICLDPREIPYRGFKDTNPKTIYYTGKQFIDFNYLDLSMYDSKDIFCFFDCHQNAYLRLLQCIEKKILNIFFNDNYPSGCGSHYTIEHLITNDTRLFNVDDIDRKNILDTIDIYYIYPNVYPGNIKTGEGLFECNSYFNTSQNNVEFDIFRKERNTYRWNTYIKLKSIL